MQTNYERKFKNINIKMPIADYKELKGFMSIQNFGTNLSFVMETVRGGPPPPFVDVNILEIDGGSPSTTSALIQVGECVYRWTGKEFEDLGQGKALRLIYEREKAQ